jgi:hypothetical protein
MTATDEIVDRICTAVPGATPALTRAILAAAGKQQIFFVEGAEQTVTEGKLTYPDYLQIQITSSYAAGRLAQQLTSACADALGNGGKLLSPVTLMIAGAAEFSE